jgi:hypothetical protein
MKNPPFKKTAPPATPAPRLRDPRTPDDALALDVVRALGPCAAAVVRQRLPGWTSGQVSRALAQAVRDQALLRTGRGAQALYQAPAPGAEAPASVLQQAGRLSSSGRALAGPTQTQELKSMPKLITPVLFLLVLLAVLAVLAAFLKRRAGADRYTRQALLTPNEYEFYQRLLAALPELLVLPQVSMAAVIAPAASDAKRRLAAFRRISQKRIDFLVCRQNLDVVCALELDDSTHNRWRDAQRDAMLASAGVPTLRYESRAKPNAAQIAGHVLALLHAAPPRGARP